MKPIYTTIPTELCGFALTQGKVNQLKLYIYLKHISSGHIRFETRYYKVWASDLDLSERTVRTCWIWLIKNKWITVNNKKNSFRIISYYQLSKKLKINEKNAVKYDSEDFSNFRGFCCAAMITFFIRKKTWIALKTVGV